MYFGMTTVVLWAKLGSFIDLELQQHNYRQVICFWEWVSESPSCYMGGGGGDGGGGKHHEAWLSLIMKTLNSIQYLPNNHSSWVHNCQASVEHR